jgi:hypothetical protein
VADFLKFLFFCFSKSFSSDLFERFTFFLFWPFDSFSIEFNPISRNQPQKNKAQILWNHIQVIWRKKRTKEAKCWPEQEEVGE